MDVNCARDTHRRACHGEVMIYKLSGGSPIKALVTNCSPGGVGLKVERSLADGEVVRLLFPRRGADDKRGGRIIIGHVTYSRAHENDRIVGIAFAWDAAVKGINRGIHKKPAPPRWYHFFAPKAKPRGPALARSR